MIIQSEAVEFAFYIFFGTIISITPFLLLATHSPFRAPFLIWRTSLDRYGRFFAFAGVLSSIMIFPLLVSKHPTIAIASLFAVSVFWGALLVVFTQTLPMVMRSRRLCYLVLAAFFILVVGLNLSIGSYGFDMIDPSGKLANVWHHWGAYLMSAKSMKAGLAIYKDFPSQYGLGPSAIIAVFSSIGGWVAGMFYAVGILQLLFWCCLSSIGISIANKHVGYNVAVWFAVMAVTTTTCFFWAGGPNFANFYPSLGGARYLPAALMATSVIIMDLTRKNYALRRGWLLHLVWVIGALWSIESLFLVSFIWWPQYILIKLPIEQSLSIQIASLLKSVTRLLCIASATLLIFLIGYYAFYQTIPDIYAFTAFATYVPGALPMNFTGPFLIILFSFALALFTLVGRFKLNGIDSDFRALFGTILLSYAAMIYYMGRSHDSNILSLLPYHGLILISLTFGHSTKFIRFAASSLLALLVGWMIMSQYENKANNFSTIINFRGIELDERFKNYFEHPIESDRGRAIDFINKNYGEAVTAFDSVASVVLSGPQTEWTAYNNTTGYYGLPSVMQKQFIKNSKERLMRKGWIILPTINPPHGLAYVLDLFAADYDIIESIVFGSYTAYRFAPK